MTQPVLATTVAGGILADRMKKNVDNLLRKIDPEQFAAIFAELHDSRYAEPEFAGQYVDVCMHEYRKTGDDEYITRAKIVVKGMIDGQRDDGYLGTYIPGKEFDETFSVWNEQFAIKGLVSYYEVTADDDALGAAMKCGDYIANHYLAEGAPDILRTGNQCVENTCILEQFVRLYRITEKPLYLEFSEFIIRRWEETTIRFISAPLEAFNPLYAMPVRKAAEALICYHGIIELAKVTENQRYIDSAKRYWELVLKQEINVIGCGALTELWVYHGNVPANTSIDVRPNETCVAYLWMRMGAMLFEMTGEAKYIDAIEKTLFNHIIGAQAIDGADFSYYQGLIGKKVHETHPGQYSCCRYRGMAFLSYISDFFVSVSDDAINVNLFAESTTDIEVDGVKVTVKQETDFPRDGKIRLIVETDAPVARALKVRRPAWCGRMSVGVEVGATSDAAVQTDVDDATAGEDGYVVLADSLQAGTQRFEIELEMTVSARPANVDHLDSACVTYGPLTLAIDSRYGTPIHSTEIAVRPDEVAAAAAAAAAGTKRRGLPPIAIDLTPVPTENLAPIVRFECDGTVNGEPATVTLVDYGSAGSLDRKNDWFKVWVPTTQQQQRRNA